MKMAIGTTTITNLKIYYSQSCLLCDNTRRLPEGMQFNTVPWVCDECKEAIGFLKILKQYDQKFIKNIIESE